MCRHGFRQFQAYGFQMHFPVVERRSDTITQSQPACRHGAAVDVSDWELLPGNNEARTIDNAGSGVKRDFHGLMARMRRAKTISCLMDNSGDVGRCCYGQTALWLGVA